MILLSEDKTSCPCNIEGAIQIDFHHMMPILNTSFQHARSGCFNLVDDLCIDPAKIRNNLINR